MSTSRRHILLALAPLPFLLLTGCPTADRPSSDGGATRADGATPPDATKGQSALAAACNGDTECASGFCVDGVCCDSTCRGQCYSCDQTGAPGHCAPQTQGHDTVAVEPCIGDSSCFLDQATRLSVCKVADGAACQTDGDCGSGHCLSYFVDADGDGYGTAATARFCNELNGPPPAGYAAYPGDCCDIDSGANPAFDSSTFLRFPDQCGSYDWNCNGVVAQQATCSGQPTLACGADCVINLGFFMYTAFTQACN
jgi:hypothetical protein